MSDQPITPRKPDEAILALARALARRAAREDHTAEVARLEGYAPSAADREPKDV